MSDTPQNNTPDYKGFNLKSVCWGYRDIFRRRIERLFREGLLGEHRREVTETFFEMLRSAGRTIFDDVLKELIEAINERTRWIMDLPGVFEDVTEMGRELARSKPYYGIAFFKIMGQGGFGDTPAQVRHLMTTLRRLRAIDEDLAFSLVKGWRTLVDRMQPDEVDRYVEEGVQIYRRNKDAGCRFMETALKSSESVIRTLTHECRLDDIRDSMERLLKALTGGEVEVADLGGLDSDELIEHGSSMVCMYKWLYVPARIRFFDDAEKNRLWYVLMGVTAAGMLSESSFPRVHGHPEFITCEDVVGKSPLRVTLFRIVENVRVLRRVRARWPGARGLVNYGLECEYEQRPPVGPADRLFFDAARETGDEVSEAASIVRELADRSVNLFATAQLLDGPEVARLVELAPELEGYPLRQFAFLPDFLYPGEVATPPRDNLVADLKQQAKDRHRPDDDKSSQEKTSQSVSADADSEETDEGDAGQGMTACYVYDEWNQPENDYLDDWCFVHERRVEPADRRALPFDIGDHIRQVRRVFERLRPEVVSKEKRLPEGDIINPDLLLQYMIRRNLEPMPRIDFYEKPMVNRRDLAVLLLMDVSGSTGSMTEQKKVIDIEKVASIVFGEGLNALGDRFAVCGFSGNGRENCEYYVYKDFDDPWDRDATQRVLGAYPSSSTRIGAALRHSGWRLSQEEARQRLIILITDGKPMDTGYDPNTRYAQHDVRMACEENRRQEVHTFCISTEENSRADMEIMFPEQRFVILTHLANLPKVLPKLYVKMTV